MTLKKNEYRSIECLSVNTFTLETLFKRQDYDEWQSVQEIIEKFTLLTKSLNWARDFWNQSCFEEVMKSRWLWIIWKTQDTLEVWNEYLKHNDHKNKIIQQTKCIHFRSQMHELSKAFKSIWCFAKWARIESQLFKKLS